MKADRPEKDKAARHQLRGDTTYTRSLSILPIKSIEAVLTRRETAGAPSIRRPAAQLPDAMAGLEIKQSCIRIVTLAGTTGSGEPIVLDAPIGIDR